MNAPFRIAQPKFVIEKNKDISFSFFTMPQLGEPRQSVVINYWTITDNRGRVVRDVPDSHNNHILHNEYGKPIKLIMSGAGCRLGYDSMDIRIRFLVQNGKSVEFHYTYQVRGGKFSLSRSDIAEMNEDENRIMMQILARAKKDRKEPVPPPPPIADNDDLPCGCTPILTALMRATYKEMCFLRNNGGKHYKVTNGQFVMQSQGGYVYRFDLEAELYLAEDSPVTLTLGLEKISGTVMVCENFQVIIVLERIPLSGRSVIIPKADISAEPWKLLEKLNNRLSRINHRDEIALKLLNDGPRLASAGSLHEISKGQDVAYKHALSMPITVIWGPPGTGKTYTMAKISAEFLSHGKTVLIVSHSNVSVDNVAKQIYSQVKDGSLSYLLQQSKILRYGYVRDEELQKNEHISSFNVAMKHNHEKAEYDQLQKRYKELIQKEPTSTDAELQREIVELNNSIKEIKTRQKSFEKRLVADAQLVATTVSKIYADSLFEDKTYDVVMFDEISMAYVSQIVCAASFARSHLICVGDFCQLAPIVLSPDNKSVLGKDLFEFLNISKGYRDVHPHPWLVMLDEQRRMHPDIAAFSAQHVYHGLLKNHESTKTSRNAIAKTNPFNVPMCLIDLHGTCCFGSKNDDNSRFNILSAVFAFATALKSEKHQLDFHDVNNEEKVGIITPYAAQTRLIKSMIQDYRHSRRSDISCATVHQFQGSERNVVIFDAVESYPSTKAGWLMSKNEGGSVTRLINVALTRSRGKFISVADKTFWMSKYDLGNTFYSLIQHMSRHSTLLDWKNGALFQYLASTDFGSSIKVFPSAISCNYSVIGDIRSAKSKILLMIPKGKIDERYATTIFNEIKQASDKKVRTTIVYDKSVKIPEDVKDISVSSDKVTMPLLFIDNKVWYGFPLYQYSYFDGTTTNSILTDIVVCFSGKYTVEMIESLVNVSYASASGTPGFSSYISRNYVCAKCKAPMMLKKGNKHFLKCGKCGATRPLSTIAVDKYLNETGGKCPTCGKDLYAKNGPYGVYVRCNNNHTYNLDEI